jgi:protein-S-isoprenylcysteine O-methyltransferase Ste14
MIERAVAYALLLTFFVLESALRKGDIARSLARAPDDQSSTLFIFLSLIIILLVSIFLDFWHIGLFHNQPLAVLGLAMMVLGLILRCYSIILLNKFYTRTLLTLEDQELIQKGPYRFIRHPCYLGTILCWGAAGLAMENYIVLIIGVVILSFSYRYRINSEEKMLVHRFGEHYRLYQKRTWRLVPGVW